MKKFFFLIMGALLVFSVPGTAAPEKLYPIRKDTGVIGSVRTYRVKANESLIEIARKFGLGYNEIVGANPSLDPFVPGKGAAITIPSSWILPDVPRREGVVINLSELRLYYFIKKRKAVTAVMTFPIGIGSEGYDTPIGRFTVTEKLIDPPWYVPPSIRRERPGLPEVVPPGPDNPLGSYALRLSLKTILIHGTNRPWCVGRRASHGCIRLYPEDIPKLFRLAPADARVTIVRQPVKVGIKGRMVYVEVHGDDQNRDFNYFDEAVRLLRKKGLLNKISPEKLKKATERKQGLPIAISAIR
jgi:L,D-transpeptidase ErfK/SrfK